MREGVDPRDVKKADEAVKITLAQVMEAYLARPGKLKASSKRESSPVPVPPGTALAFPPGFAGILPSLMSAFHPKLP